MILVSLVQTRHARPESATAFVIPLSSGEVVPPDEGPVVALSPDGSTLAYSVSKEKSKQLYIRKMDRIDTVPLAGTEEGINPFFSPDGRWLAFFADGKLKKIPIDGGASVTISDAPSPRGGCWTPDDRIIFSSSFSGGLLIVPSTGGTPQVLTTLDESKNERTHRWPEILPDGKTILFTIGWIDSPNNYDNGDIAVLSLQTKARKTLIHEARMARYASPGFILYQRLNTLFGVRFDSEKLEITSPPFPVQQGVAGETSCGAGYFSIAQNGTFAAVPTSATANQTKLVMIDRKGIETPLPIPPRPYSSPRFSPDGKQIAFNIAPDPPANGDVWTYNLASHELSRLTFDNSSMEPMWSNDGKRIKIGDDRAPVRAGRPRQRRYMGSLTRVELPTRATPAARTLGARGTQPPRRPLQPPQFTTLRCLPVVSRAPPAPHTLRSS